MIVIKVNYTTDAPIIKVNYDDAPIYISTSVDATYISVDYGSGAATNAVWGDITGTLSNQTDLQNALDAKVPYNGATGNVDLGEFELKAGQIEFDQTPTGTAGVAVTRWNDTVGTIETTLKGGNVVFRHGRDMFERVVNKTGIQLTKAAYQAVRISDAQGQRLAVELAQANNDNNSADTIGLVVETIDNNQEGYIYTVGELQNINTTGSLQGETWADGDVLYLSPTIAGRITNVKPVAPQHLVVIGYVVYAHQNNGKIFVKITNGFELGELHDVNTIGATSGQVLTYNGTIWTPTTNAAGNIYTTDGTLTGNRTVTMGSYTLSFEKDLIVNKIRVGGGTGNTATTGNTYLGYQAANTNLGYDNTAIGYQALYSLTSFGSYNTAVGNQAAYNITSGSENTFVGVLSGVAVTTGSNNTGIGEYSGYSIISGSFNTTLGMLANAPETGSYNTVVGYNSYVGQFSGSNNNTLLGSRIQFNGATSNNIILGDGSGNMRLVFNSSGDAILGGSTTYPTFSGFKLDVLGSGRFSGNLTTNVTANSIVKTNASGVLTAAIAGTDYQLPITNPITGTGASGQVAYWSGTNTQTGSATFTFSPTAQLLLNNSVTAASAIARGANFTPTLVAAANNDVLVGLDINPTFSNSAFTGVTNLPLRITGGNYTLAQFQSTSNSRIVISSNNTGAFIRYEATNDSNNSAQFGINGSLLSPNNEVFIANTSNNPIQFRISGVIKGKLFSSGNLLIQDGGTFTDSGQRLQVQGDVFIRGSGNTSGTTALTVQNSSGNLLLSISNAGGLSFRTDGLTSIIPTNDSFNLAAGGNLLRFTSNLLSTAGYGYNFVNATSSVNWTSSTGGVIYLFTGYAPTSGGGQFRWITLEGTINQTGGANGITRGLYVNPTLTAAADWRSIEWSNNTGWGLYGAGTSNNFLNGSLGIGSTGLTGYSLRVSKTLTGATTSIGVYQNGAVQSDVTGAGQGFRNDLNTAAAAFTVPSYVHYQAAQGTIGAGSTVTNQIAFAAASTMIGGTNNFGFYGDIPSGTNRWNLYMNGTANNFMSGDTGVGTATLGTATKLTVGGSETASSAIARGQLINTTLVAAANNDVLVGLDIQPTFTVGAFTGVNSYALRTNGRIYSTNSTLGFSADNAAIGTTGGIYAGSYSNIANELTVNNTNGRFNGSFASGLSVTMSHNNSSVTTIRTLSVNAPASTATTTALSLMGYIDAGFQLITLGAGSTVTNTFGLRLFPNIIGTNNVHINIGTTLPTGNWSIYTSSTYANYLNGNTIIGGSAVDGGQKLQVNGDTIMKGSGNTTATTALTVQNSDGTNILRIRNNGDIVALQSLFVGPNISGTSGIIAVNPSDGSVTISSNIDYSLRFSDLRNPANSGYSFWYTSIQYSNLSYTSGVGGYVNIQRGFAPTSGTGVFNTMILQNTINQTGGANGITRGLFVNPTLTSAADWRSIETSNNSGWSYYGAGTANSYYGGHISIGTTNTSDWLNIAAGTTAKAQINLAASSTPTAPANGDIWFDGTDLKMRIGGVTKTFTLV